MQAPYYFKKWIKKYFPNLYKRGLFARDRLVNKWQASINNKNNSGYTRLALAAMQN